MAVNLKKPLNLKKAPVKTPAKPAAKTEAKPATKPTKSKVAAKVKAEVQDLKYRVKGAPPSVDLVTDAPQSRRAKKQGMGKR